MAGQEQNNNLHELQWHTVECEEGLHWVVCSNPGPTEITQSLLELCTTPDKCNINARNQHIKSYHKEKCDGENHTFNFCTSFQSYTLPKDICTPYIEVPCHRRCKTFREILETEGGEGRREPIESDQLHELRNHYYDCINGQHWTFCLSPGMWESTQTMTGFCYNPENCNIIARNLHEDRFHKQRCDGKYHIYNVCIATDADGKFPDYICASPQEFECTKSCSTFQNRIKKNTVSSE
jgi:hypothetical protein